MPYMLYTIHTIQYTSLQEYYCWIEFVFCCREVTGYSVAIAFDKLAGGGGGGDGGVRDGVTAALSRCGAPPSSGTTHRVAIFFF